MTFSSSIPTALIALKLEFEFIFVVKNFQKGQNLLNERKMVEYYISLLHEASLQNKLSTLLLPNILMASKSLDSMENSTLETIAAQKDIARADSKTDDAEALPKPLLGDISQFERTKRLTYSTFASHKMVFNFWNFVIIDVFNKLKCGVIVILSINLKFYGNHGFRSWPNVVIIITKCRGRIYGHAQRIAVTWESDFFSIPRGADFQYCMGWNGN